MLVYRCIKEYTVRAVLGLRPSCGVIERSDVYCRRHDWSAASLRELTRAVGAAPVEAQDSLSTTSTCPSPAANMMEVQPS